MKVPPPQLHHQFEVDALVACARAVPAGGVIVEIGTYSGGTAHLLRAEAHPTVRVFSMDVNQNIVAGRHELADIDVTFIDGESSRVALAWGDTVDLLFVDGGHRLVDTVGDVLAWQPHLRPGAQVVFHDYDEPLAGGIYYPGVRLSVDTLLRLGVLADVRQHLAMVTCTVPEPDSLRGLTAGALRETLQLHAQRICDVRDYYTPALLDWLHDPTSSDVRALVDGGPDISLPHPHSDTHPIASRLNEFYICYLFDAWHREHAGRVNALVANQDVGLWHEMMRWLDFERRQPYPAVVSIEAIRGRDCFPHSLERYALSTVDEIGRFMTIEQVRLNMLSRITNPILQRVMAGYDG